MQNKREEVLRDLNVEQVVRQLGIHINKVDGSWLTCLCPFHEDSEPSFRVALEETASGKGSHEKGFWNCFAGCGSGSIYDLVIRIRGGEFRDAMEYLGGPGVISSRPQPARRNGATRPPKKVAPVRLPQAGELEALQSALLQDQQAMTWLTSERGVSEEVARAAGLGLKRTKRGRFLSIPGLRFDHARNLLLDHLKYVRIGPDRHVDDKSNFFNTKGANPKLYFPHQEFEHTKGCKFIFVVESELCALMLISHGYRAYATRGTSNFNASYIAPLAQSTPIVLWADADDAGDKALITAVTGLQAEGISCSVLEEKHGTAKDPTEVWRAVGGDQAKFNAWIEKALQNAAIYYGNPNAKVLKVLDLYERKDGTVIPRKTLPNLDKILRLSDEWGDNLWMNSMGKTRMLDLSPITDEMLSDIRLEISSRFQVEWGVEDIMQRVKALCRENERHPVQEYLETLEWDGQPRIDTLIGDVIAASPNQDIDLKKVYLRKWLIGAVARAVEPGCKMDTMLVLYSKEQGLGKSMLTEALAGEWFLDEPIRPDDKDCKLAMHRSWIVEVSELDATTRRRDLSELRAFLSKREDHIRAPYGRMSEDWPRGFVFMGTTNDLGIVKEDDGRRYWPIAVTEIDVEAVKEMRDQIWAEAAFHYARGEKWWLEDGYEARRRTDTSREFFETDTLLMAIEEWLETQPPDVTKAIRLTDLSEWLNNRGIKAPATSGVLGSRLRKLGYVHRVIGEGRLRRWVREE